MAQKDMRGKFITLEGSEGSGKSTQARMLFRYLQNKGFKVFNLREPGSTFVSERIRQLLLNPRHKAISDICEAMLYMAARAQLVDEVIKPALEAGKVVICDRFLDATLAYQGYGHGLSVPLLKHIGAFVTQGIRPDLTLLLDIETKKGLGRAGSVKDRIEQRSLQYHRRVRKGYLALARKEPKRIKIIPMHTNGKQETQRLIRKCVDALW